MEKQISAVLNLVEIRCKHTCYISVCNKERYILSYSPGCTVKYRKVISILNFRFHEYILCKAELWCRWYYGRFYSGRYFVPLHIFASSTVELLPTHIQYVSYNRQHTVKAISSLFLVLQRVLRNKYQLLRAVVKRHQRGSNYDCRHQQS